jgi:hypothetical protein
LPAVTIKNVSVQYYLIPVLGSRTRSRKMCQFLNFVLYNSKERNHFEKS